MKNRLPVGLVGLGRMGRVYAQHLSKRVPNVNLVAVADVRPDLAEAAAAEFNVPKWYQSHQELLADKDVAAVVVVTSTSTHQDVVIDATKSGKAIFCEKPLSTSLENAHQMLEAIATSGVMFQSAFQRRFDPGYVNAKKRIDAGEIGTPVSLLSISRDPFRPALEFCDPKISGGMIIDMGIHDFDLARMYMGDVKSVYSIGGTLAYPELKPMGAADNAIINMVFESEALGVVDLSMNSVFGYDIRTEIWGTEGSLQIGYFMETPVLVMKKEGITHDVVPHFMQRFEKAYLAQLVDFVENVLGDRPPSITGQDCLAAMRVSLAAIKSYKEKRVVEVSEI